MCATYLKARCGLDTRESKTIYFPLDIGLPRVVIFWAKNLLLFSVTTKTFHGNKTAKAALPLRYGLICQGLLLLSVSSGPLLSANEREKGDSQMLLSR